ncbi:DNA repair protein RAD50 [Lindgomyces ingoldianus]|uniref:DNA repair protein RAD50 n=1 Tax=Lindgomyces ingoldianus TaxID=673940 RepID=A0ACB6QBF1_9PLEO|nr:DNA repair protein RAD50 [Lindgomyces ingoldianus]KAF2464236.1 DNA repair protein RAD50 [Lindgomyces ingoldianus]
MSTKEMEPPTEQPTVSQPSTPTLPSKENENPHEYPSAGKLWLLMLSLYMSMFLISLDKTIIATAIPQITNSFNSLSDIGWYGSSYMLTLCAFQLVWGRIYTFYSPKTVFLTTIFIFEVGSAICGAAPSSTGFIIGRAIAGMGSAGISNGAIILVMHTVPLEKRPMFQGFIGAVFGVASVVGPLLGGVFTQKLSWRWCFYINLPLGAVSAAVLILFLRLPKRKEEEKVPLRTQIKKLDPIGTAVFLPSIVCLLLALQWGGTTYPWSNWRIILLLVLFPLLFAAFMALQICYPDTATLPLRILTQRTVFSGFFYAFTSQASVLVITYYIPLFFQALKDFSPVSSGFAILPSVLTLVIGAMVAGGLVQRFGYPAPFMYISCILSAVGAGMISTWPISATTRVWIGYQVLFGLGIGLGMQQPSISVQCVLPRPDVSMGISLMFFGQNLGGAVFISTAQNVFVDTLARKLSEIPGVGITRQMVVEMGATQLVKLVGEELRETVLEGYHVAIRNAFYVGVGLSCVSLIGALGVEWVSVKKGEKMGSAGKDEKKEVGGDKLAAEEEGRKGEKEVVDREV